ncbi:MAG: methyltransferase domain-containing protein, partial [Alphaproteobacteria bacterium]|nr:methyltransferase domain-containing protein [Alphaproteobacteria bacterium]
MANESYAIAGGEAGRERLRVVARVFGPGTANLLDAAGVGEGMACLDVGSGGGDVSRELARRVGPTGSVLGIDLDTVKVDIARKEAAARDL